MPCADTNDLQLRKAGLADFAAMARLIVAQNQNAARHCIQSETGQDEESIAREMSLLAETGEFCGVVVIAQDRLVGVLGCEVAEDIGRGWLRGPFVITDNWPELASALLEHVVKSLPATIHRLDSFLNIAHEQGNSFYLQQGFEQMGLVHVYIARQRGLGRGIAEVGQTVKPENRQAVISLHDTIFPGVYINGQAILDKLDEDHQLFVYSRAGEVLGYIYAVIQDGGEEGYIEFVGVRADARGQGIGKALLLTAPLWFFEVKGMPQVGLTVNDNLTNARALYEQVGFRLQYTGVHTRKTW